MRELWRICGWGLAAALSLVIAVFSGTTDAGFDRARYAAQQIREIVAPTGVQAARPLDANEGRRLAETVRALTADRERLLTRLAAVEHSVDDMTGSITRFEKAVKTPAEQVQPVTPPAPPPIAAVAPPPVVTAPQTVTPARPPVPLASVQPQPPPQPQASLKPIEEFTSRLSGPDASSLEPVAPAHPAPATSLQQSNTATTNPATTATVTKRQFGLDLGGSPSEDAARMNWNNTLRRHGGLLQGLKPVVLPREHPRGGMEYRLIAGPINDASKAARFCAAITAMGGVCQPAMYDGQRVAAH